MVKNMWLIRSTVLFVLAAVACTTIDGTAFVAKPSPPQVTEVTLERISGGPQPDDLPPDKVVLRRAELSDHFTAPTFDRLAQWLQASGFFSRKGGTASAPFLPDAGSLTITVVRGGRTKQVVSFNGLRDEELWQTEMVIRGAAADIAVRQAHLALLEKYRVTHPNPALLQKEKASRPPPLPAPRPLA